jgi:hypothetical protein
MMTVKPNVTSRELNGVISNRAKSHCIATPSAKNAGTISSERQQRVDLCRRRKLIAEYAARNASAKCARLIWRSKPPRQAEPEAQQPVESADEDPDSTDCASSEKLGSPIVRALSRCNTITLPGYRLPHATAATSSSTWRPAPRRSSARS